ncbi:MAG: hydrogenase nickel incorporation protein HypB [Xanthomonadales bacterium]
MCDTCGCNVTKGNAHLVDKTSVEVLTNLLHENDHVAAHNREHFERHGVLAVNLMSSPGSGKTSLLEATIEALGDELKVAVVEGDLETENDAERIRARGVPAVQITTGQACHLDAHMVHDALHDMDLDGIDVLFIENVGNLVCPASFDLGHHANVTLLSVTEGDDKPAKYPVMFRAADLVLLSKADFLDVIDDFDPAKAERHVRELANPAPVHLLSVRRPDSLAPWLDWLREQVRAVRDGQALHPQVQAEGAALHLGS